MRTQGKAYRKGQTIDGKYDAIIVGSGIGGLGAASILAQQGRRILILEQHNVVGGLTQSYERAGYRWSVGLHYIGDVGSRASMARRLFDYVTKCGVEWAPMPVIFNRFLINGREYRIPAGTERYRAALKEWFPAETKAIDRYLEIVREVNSASGGYFAQQAFPLAAAQVTRPTACTDFDKYADRVTFDVLSELTDDHDLIAVLTANWGDYGVEPTRSSFAMHAMLAKHYLDGGFYPVGGGQAFADSIVPIVEQAGGLVLHSAKVAQITTEASNVTGVTLEDGTHIASDIVISDAGLHNTIKHLIAPDVSQRMGFDRDLESVQQSYTVVGLSIGLEGSAAALGLEAANIWCHPTNDYAKDLAVHRADFSAPFAWTFITFPSAKDPSWENDFPGRSAIEMFGCSDYRHFERWAETRWQKRGEEYLRMKADIEKRLLDELYRLVPGTKGAVRYVEVSTPLTYNSFLRRTRGDFMGIESSPQRFRQTWLRARTPITGLFLTGQDIATDGVIGALAGATICTSALLMRDMLGEIRNAPLYGDAIDVAAE